MSKPKASPLMEAMMVAAKERPATLKEAIARLEKTEAELRDARAALRHRDEQLAFVSNALRNEQRKKTPR